MPSRDEALEQIDMVFRYRDSVVVHSESSSGEKQSTVPQSEWGVIATMCISCCERLVGSSSVYFEQMRAAQAPNRPGGFGPLLSVLRALRHDIDAGYLDTLTESVRAEYSGDMLSYADTLLAEKRDGPVTAAAVLAGGVLEEHVRNLCAKQGISTERPNNRGDSERLKVSAMTAELKRAGIYGNVDDGNVLTWYRIRSHAAHAEYDKYTADDVRLMIAGLRSFIVKYPA